MNLCVAAPQDVSLYGQISLHHLAAPSASLASTCEFWSHTCFIIVSWPWLNTRVLRKHVGLLRTAEPWKEFPGCAFRKRQTELIQLLISEEPPLPSSSPPRTLHLYKEMSPATSVCCEEERHTEWYNFGLFPLPAPWVRIDLSKTDRCSYVNLTSSPGSFVALCSTRAERVTEDMVELVECFPCMQEDLSLGL